ncbi:sialoadhesin-like [Boleophthalmus pectinirostris]|uniref:sialoadhesin-like n=1 Tax=Boleophthalmus pectinirostris TaxID=150288 RepID=UPI00242FFE45|nr:sialoadhesin-like [Boleophthalmus pectinirostris]XP_055012729.1 sialoadhesin-like [Boleophthalmus pectinirostris]
MRRVHLLLSAVWLLCEGRLIVHPDRAWFFRYESVSFRCSGPRGPGGRTGVFRNTSSRSVDPCESKWGNVNGTTCTINDLFTLDSGLYWCDAEQQRASDVLNLTVTSGSVLLSVPARPVLQGATVSLVCLYKDGPKVSAEFSGRFYRNGTLLGENSPAILRLPGVTVQEQGLYHCVHHTSRGRSADVPLTVSTRTQHESTTETTTTTRSPLHPTVTFLSFGLLFLLYTCILCIAFCICHKLRKARAEDKQRGANL